MKIIDLVFVKNNIAKIVSDITGFYYSIDFLLVTKLFTFHKKIRARIGMQISGITISLLVKIL